MQTFGSPNTVKILSDW